jgi:hypothetical protein
MATDVFGKLVESTIQSIRSYVYKTNDCSCDGIFETLTYTPRGWAANVSVTDLPVCVRREMVDSFAHTFFARSFVDVGSLMISMLSVVDLQLACVNKRTLQLHILCANICTCLLARSNVPFSSPQECRFRRLASTSLKFNGASSNLVRWYRVQFYIVWWLEKKTAWTGQNTCLPTVRHLLDVMHEDGVIEQNYDRAILHVRYSNWFDIELPDRRYWLHWVDWIEKEVSVRESNAFTNECTFHDSSTILPDATLNRIVYMLVSFTVYISRVCPCCASVLEINNYRIHPQYGIQTRVAGGVWVPDPVAFWAAVDNGTIGRGVVPRL